MNKTIISLLTALLCTMVNARQIPASLVGNWIETQSNEWRYGFFEKFAVYRCGFWEYASVQQKGKTTRIVLQKDGQTISLDLAQKNDSMLTIRNGKSGKQDFVLMRKRYPDYRTADNTPFPAPTFRQDSATVIGYYRNFDRLPELPPGIPDWFKRRYFNPVFKISVPDFLSGKQPDYQAPIDSLGRFSLTFPIVNSQEVYADWGRLTRQLVFSPNDTLFIFADITELVPAGSIDYWNDFYLRDKQILLMGDNARPNNELIRYKSTYSSFNAYETSGIPDMEFLKLCTEDYETRKNSLENYISTHPNVSGKFRFYKRNWETYQLARNLLQYRFRLPASQMRRFSEEYTDYVEKNIPRYNPEVYTLVREYESFISDYIDYYSGAKSVDLNTVMFLEETGLNTPENIRLFDEYDRVIHEYTAEKDTARQKELLAAYKELIDQAHRITFNPLIEEAREAYIRRTLTDMDYHKADSLLQEPVLSELWTAHLYLKDFEQHRMPLQDRDVQVMKTRVTSPFLLDKLLTVNDHYAELNKRIIQHEESLKNTDHLANETDADTIFGKLIEPYRGKVIFADFWGTWCGPCINDIKTYSHLFEEKFRGKDVIFMYLANRSSEHAWRKFIRQQQLTGPQIVHYRLPDQQQVLLERKLNVRSFPTQFVIDQTGDVTGYHPVDFDETVRELERILNLGE